MKKIRLWKLGSLEHGMVPTKETIEEFRKKIEDLVKAEDDVYNFVWGPDLTIEEYIGEPGVLKAARIGFARCEVKSEEKQE